MCAPVPTALLTMFCRHERSKSERVLSQKFQKANEVVQRVTGVDSLQEDPENPLHEARNDA